MSLVSMLSVVVSRGLIMQSTVKGDEPGPSPFGMSALSQIRLPFGQFQTPRDRLQSFWLTARHLAFSTEDLQGLVRTIATEIDTLLEIVSFNIEGQQDVCSGNVSLSFTKIFCQDDAVRAYAEDSTTMPRRRPRSSRRIVKLTHIGDCP